MRLSDVGADKLLQKISNLWAYHNDKILEIGMELIASLIIIIIGVLISKGLNRVIKKAANSKINVDGAVSIILRNIISYGIFIICVIMILNIFGVNTTSLLALLGAAGLAVGLALKDTLGNIASGIILFFLGSYRLGEFIEFGSFIGTVKEINLFATILETPDGIYISAPNSSIWGNPVKNYSRNGKRRMELAVRISYSDSLDTAFQVLNEIAASETRFLKDPAPQIIVQSLQDSSVNLVIRAWAENKHYWDIYWEKMRMLKEKIEEAGLHIPFPQNDVRVVQG
jgi:small conductance mechanosensitive channel